MSHAGTEAIIHATHAWANTHPEGAILQVDITNAFNAAS